MSETKTQEIKQGQCPICGNELYYGSIDRQEDDNYYSVSCSECDFAGIQHDHAYFRGYDQEDEHGNIIKTWISPEEKIREAAPDLLEVVETGLGLREHERQHPRVVNWPKWEAEARAAIAKATKD